MYVLHNKCFALHWSWVHTSAISSSMKYSLISLLSLILASLSAIADTSFYQCTLPQAEEYRVGIDIKNNIAGFFDNDSTSIMKFRGLRDSISRPDSPILIFTGKDSGGDGDLKLEFNTASNRVKLSTIETDGTIELLGYAACAAAHQWEWSSEDLAIP